MLRTCTVLHCLRFYDMENFVRVRLPWLKTFLRLRNESPSHDNRNRVFQALDPKEFGECMAQWTQSKRTVPGGEGVALDGKAIRRVHSIKAKTPASLSAVGDPRRPAAGPAQGQGQEQRNHHPAGVAARALELAAQIVTADVLALPEENHQRNQRGRREKSLALNAIKAFLDETIQRREPSSFMRNHRQSPPHSRPGAWCCNLN